VFYWTNGRLKTFILPYISARETHYGRALDCVKRLLANGQVIESKYGVEKLLQEYDRRAPHESEIDRDRLLEVFDQLDERTRERLGAILLAERDRLDLQGRRVPEISQKRPFEVKRYPAKFGKEEPRFAPHTPMTAETRELVKELKELGTSAIVIDCQDEGVKIKPSPDIEPDLVVDTRIRKLWRRHPIRAKKKLRP
jgi:hypothetical protein